MQTLKLLNGDCVQRMAEMAEASVDAIVCDPPYGLVFMGRAWDDMGKGAQQRVWHKAWLEQAYRVLKPGGLLLAFNGTRTHHHLSAAMQQVGFANLSVRAWAYGSGFPKSLNVSKALDKMAGAKREKVQPNQQPAYQRSIGNTRPWMDDPNHKIDGPIPVTEAASQWNGWGSSLKPAWEPIIVGTKPEES